MKEIFKSKTRTECSKYQILSRNIIWVTYPRSGRTSGFHLRPLSQASSTVLDIVAVCRLLVLFLFSQVCCQSLTNTNTIRGSFYSHGAFTNKPKISQILFYHSCLKRRVKNMIKSLKSYLESEKLFNCIELVFCPVEYNTFDAQF